MTRAGAAFPFDNTIKGILGYKTRKESLLTSLMLILTTPKGSIPYNPEQGSQVPYLVFDPLDDAVYNLILFYTKNDIEEQDPRIKITSISIQQYEDDPHKISIWIGYRDRNDVTQKQEQAPVDFVRG